MRTAPIYDLTLARAKKGDRDALSHVLSAHSAAVYAVVGRMLVAHPAAVDDVAQEVFIKAMRFLSSFRGTHDGPELGRWFAAMATRTCLDYFRKPVPPEPTPMTQLDERAGMEATPEEITGQRELEARVSRAVGELPAEQRAALMLRAFHDFDYPDIAEALAVEVGTVKSRLSRARQALQRLLLATGEER